jgi:hypothetical protein
MEGYTYDLALLITGKFPSTGSELMQRAQNIVHRWCREQSVYSDKMEIVLFTKKKKVEGFVEPILLNTVSHTTRSPKYLWPILEGACETEDQ